MNSFKFRKYPFTHRLISFFRDIDIKGFRRLSVFLPKLLLPKPEEVGEHIIQTIHGFGLKINPSIDNGVELSLFQTGTYEKGILSFLEKNLKNDDCFIDVGSNIGLMTIFASKQVGENVSVFSFEAHPETFKILEFNLDLNKITNVIKCNFALGANNYQSVIYDNWQVNRGGASLIIKDIHSSSFPIEVKRLDDFLSKEIKPKIIKVDVEGFELEVLKGAKEIISKCKPILIVELSSNRENSYEINELIDFILSFDSYDLYKLEGTKERVSKLIKIISKFDLPEHDNIICISK